ncbi:MAG: RNA polymerase sigma factor [Flavobacteriales bacterium]|nr:RNA polymerase sigma factor [Flavobacteriales bacterium]
MKELILNEEKLIERCVEKDRHAQESLYNQFYSDLYLIAMRYLSDHHEAEDAIILSFTKVFKNLRKFNFQGKGSLGKWIRTILINEAIRLLKKRRQLHFNDEVHQLKLENSEANGLEQMQAADIFRMIEQLPAGYRTVFNLHVVEGFSHKEIAALLKVSESTSKTQLKKARNSLMNRINQEKAYGTV